MSFDFNFTPTILQKIIPTNTEYKLWHDDAIEILPKYNINTKLRVSAFLTQCAHESLDFKIMEENLNYSEQGLLKTFKKHFPNGLEKSYARNPQKIASRVYGNRMGNGPESSGDGWKYRGRGIIQLTGFNNYKAFGDYIGMTPDEVINYVKTKRGALECACWFWNSRNISVPADKGDITTVSRLINGGTNGLQDRINRYNAALQIINSDQSNKSNIKEENITKLVPSKRGDTNDTVKLIQEYLKINADGIFGPNTESSVKRWQQFNGLSSTGVADVNTLKKMFPKYYT